MQGIYLIGVVASRHEIVDMPANDFMRLVTEQTHDLGTAVREHSSRVQLQKTAINRFHQFAQLLIVHFPLSMKLPGPYIDACNPPGIGEGTPLKVTISQAA
jgi:hypothetical protein